MTFDKSFLKSKTLWVNLIAIIGGFFPAVREILEKNPEAGVYILGGINFLLRLMTKEKLTATLPAKKLE